MGHKTHPTALRLGIIREWASKWFAVNYQDYLREDTLLREWLRKRLRRSFVNEIAMERSGTMLKIEIATSRPGMLIGRGGAGIEELKRAIVKKLEELRGKKPNPADVRLEVQEVRNPDSHAMLISQNVAEQLERRLPFRRVLKRTLERAMSAPNVAGARIAIAGRLGGSEMSRREWAADGKVPLHTFRADIDFAQETAYTTWGTKGEVFKEKGKQDSQ